MPLANKGGIKVDTADTRALNNKPHAEWTRKDRALAAKVVAYTIAAWDRHRRLMKKYNAKSYKGAK